MASHEFTQPKGGIGPVHVDGAAAMTKAKRNDERLMAGL